MDIINSIKDTKPPRDEQYKGYTVHFIRLISNLKGYTFIPQILAYINKEKPSFKKAWIQSRTCTSKYKAFADIKKKIDKMANNS